MRYISALEREDTFSRFGALETSTGLYDLPTSSPSPLNKRHVRAIKDLQNKGLRLDVLSPPLSHKNEVYPELSTMLATGLNPFIIGFKKPLILPDIETEIFTFNCDARKRLFRRDDKNEKYVAEDFLNDLVNSSLSGEDNTYLAWRRTIIKFTNQPLLNWMSRQLSGIGSDVFLVPTPMIRAEKDTSRLALDIAKASIPTTRLDPKFTLYGVQFLFYGELFKSDDVATNVRQEFIENLRLWRNVENLNGLFISVKVHDPASVLENSNNGNSSRKNLSEFITNIHEIVEESGSILSAINWGNWALGLLDSGSDIVSFRMDGEKGIDRIFHRKAGGKIKGKPKPKSPPDFMVPRSLTDVDYKLVKRTFNRTGAFPCTQPVNPQPYWEFSKREDQLFYTEQERCAVLREVGEEYRNEGIVPHSNLKDSVLSRVRDSDISQTLSDLCPSTW